MATNTPNYNLKKPVDVDLVDVASDISASMTIIDTELKEHKDRLGVLEPKAVLAEAPPFALIRKNANQTLNDATTLPVTFQVNAYSRPAGFANEANERLVVPVAGWYEIELQIVFASSANGRRDVVLQVNGTAIKQMRFNAVAVAAVIYMQTKWTVLLAVNDLLTVTAFQNSGGASDVASGAQNTASETFLSARWLTAPF